MRGRQQQRGRDGDNRCTPEPIWSAALEAAGDLAEFDLDPASNPHSTVPARVAWYGTSANGWQGEPRDGLALPWFGNVWLNYPWSRPRRWIEKVIAEASSVDVRSVTVNGNHDLSTAWARKLTGECDAWAAWPKRLNYPFPGQPSGSPPGTVALWYFGPNAEQWLRVMHAFGCIAYPKHVDD